MCVCLEYSKKEKASSLNKKIHYGSGSKKVLKNKKVFIKTKFNS